MGLTSLTFKKKNYDRLFLPFTLFVDQLVLGVDSLQMKFKRSPGAGVLIKFRAKKKSFCKMVIICYYSDKKIYLTS